VAAIIKIKRSTGISAPSSLKAGELAYSYGTGTDADGGDRLYYGQGDSDGAIDATSIVVIGGKYFADLLDHTPGTLTASSAIIVDSDQKINRLLVSDITIDSSGIDLSNDKITNLATPTADADATTKAYVDTQIGANSVITVKADSGSDLAISLLDSSLSILGGTNIGSILGDSNTVTINLDSSVYGLAALTADSSSITNISGTSLNYSTINATTGTVSQLSSDSAHIGVIDNNTLRTNALAADSGTITTLNSTDLVSTNITRTNTTVAAGTYGSASLVPSLTINASGFVDSIGTVAVAGVTSTSYDSATGVFTINTADGGVFTTTIHDSDDRISEIRNAISAAGDLSYNSSTGVFSFDVEQVYTKANFDSDFNTAIDEALLGGTGLAYDAATNTLSIDSAELENYFKSDIRGYLASSTGLTYDSTAGSYSITNTGVTAGTYGSASLVPVLTINAQGQIDSAGTLSVAGVTGFAWDSSTSQATITTADGGSFPATINGFGDNRRLYFGDANEASIRHTIDGKTILEMGPSEIDIDGGGHLLIKNSVGGAKIAEFTPFAGVDLYHASAKKFATTDSGIAVGGNILPLADSTYDLGSPTRRFKDLYLSGNSLVFGGIVMTDSNGQVAFRSSTTNNAVGISTLDDSFQRSSLVSDTSTTNQLILQQRLAGTVTRTNGTLYNDSDVVKGLQYIPTTTEGSTETTISLGRQNVIYAHNQTGGVIYRGDLVFVDGTAHGSHPRVSLARANSAKENVIGMATTDIVDNAHGFITRFGIVDSVNTGGLAEGSSVFLSKDSAGKYTSVDVDITDGYPFKIGTVVKVDSSAGSILVDPYHEHFDRLRIENNLRVDGHTTVDSADVTLMSFNTTRWTDIDIPNNIPWPLKEGNLFYFQGPDALTYTNASMNVKIAQDDVTRVYNNSGTAIAKGKAVYITGAANDFPTIALAKADNFNTLYNTVGLTSHAIENGAFGFVTTRGLYGGLNTAGFTVGDRVHVSPDSAGELVDVNPTFPNYAYELGIVLIADSATGGNVGGCIQVIPRAEVFETLRVQNDGRIDGNLTVTGNLNILGTETKTSVATLAVGDQYISVQEGDTITTVHSTGTGLNDITYKDHYQGNVTQSYFVEIFDADSADIGDTIRWGLDSANGGPGIGSFSYLGFDSAAGSLDWNLLTDGKEDIPLRFNITVDAIAASGHDSGDVWSGVAAIADEDFGFYGNYNAGSQYTLAGFFRDATDNKFKFFNRYDSSEIIGDIDTAANNFTLATIAANIEGNLTGDVTGNADTATLLETTRNIGMNGDVTSDSVGFNGGSNITITTTINDGAITNAKVATAAGIIDTKLATISTPGKVQNAATTATSINTGSAIVARDASGNFTAGSITANLVGRADSATNASQLQNQGGSYYLDYTNFTNTPTTVSTFTNDANYLDSTTAQNLIDAAYIQANQTTYDFLDSAEAINLIDSDYVQLRQDYAYASLTGAPTNVSDFTNDAGYITSADATLDSAEAINLIDSDYIELRRPPESIFTIVNNGASAYTFNGDGFSSSRDNPTLYLTRGKTYKFSMAASGHPFQIRVSDGGSAYNTGVTNNGAETGDIFFTPDMNAPTSLVYQCTVHSGMIGDIFIVDEAYITGLIDSAYVQARQSGVDSSAIIALIDSNYVSARQSIDSIGSLSNVTYGVPTAGQILKYDAGTSKFVLSPDAGGLDSSLTSQLIDSDYIQDRVSAFKRIIVPGQTGDIIADSANDVLTFVAGAGISLVTDSASDTITVISTVSLADGVNVAKFHYTAIAAQTVFEDSDDNGEVLLYNPNSSEINVYLNGLLLVDSDDYTESTSSRITLTSAAAADDRLTVIKYTPPQAATIDSAAVQGIIDSDWVQARQTVYARGELEVNKFFYTATAAQTVFTGADDFAKVLSVVPNNTQVYVSGALLRDSDEYNLTSNTLTLVTGPDSGTFVDIIETIGRVMQPRGFTETVYNYTATAAQTVFTGADINNQTLDLLLGSTTVFRNGLLLRDSADYSTTSTSVTMDSASTVGDLISIINRKGTVVSPTLKSFEFTADSGQSTITGSDDNGLTLSYVNGQVELFLNGVRLRSNIDYTTSKGGTSIAMINPLDSGDDIVVNTFAAPGVYLNKFKFDADSGQTVFTGVDKQNEYLAYEASNVNVYKNGLLLDDSDDYSATSGNSITLTAAAALNDAISIVSYDTGLSTRRVNSWVAPASTPYAASPGDKLFIDTSSPKTVTLPSIAILGDEIRIIDATGSASSNNITVSRNGHNIQGAASDLTINIDRAGIGLVYYNVTQGWVLIEN